MKEEKILKIVTYSFLMVGIVSYLYLIEVGGGFRLIKIIPLVSLLLYSWFAIELVHTIHENKED